MFDKILVCYDAPKPETTMLKRAMDLGSLTRAQIHLLSIIPPFGAGLVLSAASMGALCIATDESEFRSALARSMARFTARGIDATGHLTMGDKKSVIIAYAKKLLVDLVVLSEYPQPRGQGWWLMRRNSFSELTNCPIFVAGRDSDAFREASAGR